MNNIYQSKGYKNRNHYLESLASEYDIDEDIVFSLADMLGESEDFDGLVMALEDCVM